MTATGSTVDGVRRLASTVARRLAALDRGWRATALGVGIALSATVFVP